jgi:hypothetical protein
MHNRTEPSSYMPPSSPEEWEQVRRSVAMLSPGAWALRREPALHALGLVMDHVRWLAGTSPPTGPNRPDG